MIEIAACVISALTNECKRLSAQLDARSEMLEQIEGVCVQHDVSVPPGSTIADAVRALAAEMVAHRAAADAAERAAAARAVADADAVSSTGVSADGLDAAVAACDAAVKAAGATAVSAAVLSSVAAGDGGEVAPCDLARVAAEADCAREAAVSARTLLRALADVARDTADNAHIRARRGDDARRAREALYDAWRRADLVLASVVSESR